MMWNVENHVKNATTSMKEISLTMNRRRIESSGRFLQTFEESEEHALRSSLRDDSGLDMSILK